MFERDRTNKRCSEYERDSWAEWRDKNPKWRRAGSAPVDMQLIFSVLSPAELGSISYGLAFITIVYDW